MLTPAPSDPSLPKDWPRHVRSAVLHVIALAHAALTRARGWCLNCRVTRARLAGELDRAHSEISLLREELRIKDVRMAKIEPKRRPQYPPTARLAILELRAARGCSLAQTARTFLLEPVTVAAWMRRVDEEGPRALVRLHEPVNRFPDFVTYLVQRLKVLCPTMGKAKIARHLARAGLHLGVTTVGRMLKGPARKSFPPAAGKGMPPSRVVTAKRPHHVWHLDLTTVPIGSGFWVTWLPFAMPQRWPFCWWVLAVVDHFSRRALALRLFKRQPGAGQVCAVLGQVSREVGKAPRYTVTDKGSQFDCPRFRRYCGGRGIRPRFGAVGKRGSIAVVERFIRSFKVECVRSLPLVPMGFDDMRAELDLYARWFNGHRPHEALESRTPDEVYHRRAPAHAKPRSEPRARWPRESPCAAPQARIRGPSDARMRLELAFVASRPHLPIVRLRRTA